MNFEFVMVTRPDGTQERLSAEQFNTIGLTERVKLVSAGKVSFYRDGKLIPPVEALRRPTSA